MFALCYIYIHVFQVGILGQYGITRSAHGKLRHCRFCFLCTAVLSCFILFISEILQYQGSECYPIYNLAVIYNYYSCWFR